MSRSPGLKAAQALIDAAVEYDESVLNNEDMLINAVANAVNSVLSITTKYTEDGAKLKPYIKEYLKERGK